MLLGLPLCTGDQLGRSDPERDCKRCDGGEGRSALGTLDPADVVPVDTGIETKALLGDPKLVAEVADRLAKTSE